MKLTTPKWLKPQALNSPQVGEENQFGSSRGLRFGPLRINKTGIFANNGTTDSVVVNSSGFHGFNNLGIEQITVDSSTGLDVKDDALDSVFQAVINGTNVGDVTIGNYAGSNGLFYDKSAGSFDFKGSLTIGTTFSVTAAGVLTATSGSIAGWTIASTTLSKNNAILDSAGSITVSNGDDKVVMTAESGVGYVDFYNGGSRKGRLRGTTAGAGGIAVVGGDMALDNNKSYLAKGTGSDYARFGVDGSNNTLLVSVSDYIQFLQNDGGSLATMGTASGGYPYLYVPEGVIQLKKMSAPATPAADTVVIYLDTADEVLKAKDDAGNVHALW